jgi:hypothetical protein
MNGLDENVEAVDEATKEGTKLLMANPEDCPDGKPNPRLEPPNCELLAKPTLPPKEEACAGGSPGGGGGFTNRFDDAADVAEATKGLEGDAKGNGLLKRVGEPIESPDRGDGKSAFLFPTLNTVKTTPSFNLRDAPSSNAASMPSFDSKYAVAVGLPSMCLKPTTF